MAGTTFLPKDANFDARVRASFARQQVMATLGVEISRLSPCAIEPNHAIRRRVYAAAWLHPRRDHRDGPGHARGIRRPVADAGKRRRVNRRIQNRLVGDGQRRAVYFPGTRRQAWQDHHLLRGQSAGRGRERRTAARGHHVGNPHGHPRPAWASARVRSARACPARLAQSGTRVSRGFRRWAFATWHAMCEVDSRRATPLSFLFRESKP